MSHRPHPDTDRVFFTDGGASPNPGPGGWGVVILDPRTGRTEELSGGEDSSTNNRMELTAAIEALDRVQPGEKVELVTDSTYVRQGITQWVSGWKSRGWKRREGTRWVEVKNVDLWRQLDALSHGVDVSWHWVKGHAGHEHNERADELATEQVRRHGGKVEAAARRRGVPRRVC